MKQVNKFYRRYEFLVKNYVSKIEINDSSMELCDIEQELRLKLFTAIIAYGKKWAYYRKNNRLKPIPIMFYLKSVLNNRMIDLYKTAKTTDSYNEVFCTSCGSGKVKKIGVKLAAHNKKDKSFQYCCNKCKNIFTPPFKRNTLISKDQYYLDMGHNPVISEIKFAEKILVIEGHDFLLGMSPIQKSCMCMFFKGFPKPKIAKVFKKHFDDGYNGVLDFIENTLEDYKNSEDVQNLLSEVSDKLNYSYVVNNGLKED